MPRIAYPPSAGGGGGAPTDAQYVVLAVNGSLTDERVLAVGTGLDLTDGGAGGNATLDLDLSELATTLIAADDTLPFADTSAGAPTNGKTTLHTLWLQMRRELPRQTFFFCTDFLQETSSTNADGALVETNSGTGAGTAATPGNAQHPGVLQASTGTTATGKTALMAHPTALRFGGGEWFYEAIIQVPVLSTSTERFQFAAGFTDNTGGVGQIDGVYFLYDEGGISTGSSATPNWQQVTSTNSTRTYTTTGTAVTAGQWYRLRIVVNAAGTNVDFSIDGVDTGTDHTTNIPTAAGRETGFGLVLVKAVGTTARTVLYDYCTVVGDLTTAR